MGMGHSICLATRVLGGATLILLMAGCGSVRETLPGRSAMEQMLISTAADRAVGELPTQIFQGKAVFLDTTNLDCTDKAYVIQRMRAALRQCGANLTDAKDQADLFLEAGSGTLSLNKRDMMFGIPSLPLPFAGETLKLPELPLWKLITYDGRAKFLFSLVDAKTGQMAADIPLCYGSARETYWWCLIVGPVKNSDLPAGAK